MTRVALALAVVAVLLTACGGDDPPGEPAAIDGVTWELISGTVDGEPLSPPVGNEVTLLVEGLQASGTAACNHYFGEFRQDGERVQISEIGATEMACEPQEVMDVEQRFLAALARVEQAGRTGERLVLSGAGVELELAAQP